MYAYRFDGVLSIATPMHWASMFCCMLLLRPRSCCWKWGEYQGRRTCRGGDSLRVFGPSATLKSRDGRKLCLCEYVCVCVWKYRVDHGAMVYPVAPPQHSNFDRASWWFANGFGCTLCSDGPNLSEEIHGELVWWVHCDIHCTHCNCMNFGASLFLQAVSRQLWCIPPFKFGSDFFFDPFGTVSLDENEWSNCFSAPTICL